MEAIHPDGIQNTCEIRFSSEVAARTYFHRTCILWKYCLREHCYLYYVLLHRIRNSDYVTHRLTEQSCLSFRDLGDYDSTYCKYVSLEFGPDQVIERRHSTTNSIMN